MPLLTGLESYWKLDEASGNILDAHGSNTLVETSGTIGTASGKLNGARDFEAGDTEYAAIADNASVSLGDIDFSFTGWFQCESLPGTNMHLLAVWNATGSQESFRIHINTSSILTFQVNSTGSGVGTSVTASTFGALSTGTWYFFCARHDAAANTIEISINAGVFDSASHSGGAFDSTTAFTMGARSNLAQYFDGLMDEFGFWKKKLSDAEVVELYGAGTPPAYPFSTADAVPQCWSQYRRRRAA